MRERDIERMLNEREALLVRDYDTALDLARFDRRETILDVATGPGRMLHQLMKRGYSVVSGDIDPEALDRARERLGDLADKPTLLIMDAHRLQYEDDSFSAVTLSNANHDMDDPRRALDEIKRVLTADGKLLVTEFNTQGFELMELHHRLQGRGKHRKGEMSTEDIDSYLRSSFNLVETRELVITHAWVASGKRQSSNQWKASL